MEGAGSSSCTESQRSRLIDNEQLSEALHKRPAVRSGHIQSRLSQPTINAPVRVQPMNDRAAGPSDLSKQHSVDVVPVVPPAVTSAKNKEAGVVLSIGEKLRTLMVNKRSGSMSNLEKNLLKNGENANSNSFNKLIRQSSTTSDDTQPSSSNGGAFGGRHRDRGRDEAIMSENKHAEAEEYLAYKDSASCQKRRYSIFSRRRSSAMYIQKDDDTQNDSV